MKGKTNKQANNNKKIKQYFCWLFYLIDFFKVFYFQILPPFNFRTWGCKMLDFLLQCRNSFHITTGEKAQPRITDLVLLISEPTSKIQIISSINNCKSKIAEFQIRKLHSWNKVDAIALCREKEYIRCCTIKVGSNILKNLLIKFAK